LGATIESAEIFFLGKRHPFHGKSFGNSFRGIPVFFNKRLSENELAPIRKIFSIRDIFIGPRNREGSADIGMKFCLTNGKEMDVLLSMTSFWMTASSEYEEKLLPLDPHAVFLLREAIQPLAPSGWKREIDIGANLYQSVA
jgi:hypothetical protein